MPFPSAVKTLSSTVITVAHQPFWSRASIPAAGEEQFWCPNKVSLVVFVWMTLNKWLSVSGH